MESKLKKEQKPKAKSKPCRKYKKRQPKPAANLPEPIDVAAARIEQSQPANEDSGLLSQIGSLFTGADNPGAANSASPALPVSSTSTDTSLPPESERLLSAIPSTIGGEADDPGGPADVPDQDPIAALMAQVAFEPQDVQDVIAEFFDWMAERFESDHWKLNDRQAHMLGRPAAQLANSMWVKLQNYLPDILSKWCEETPGATAFILVCGIVVFPKVQKQVSISRERAKAAQPALVKEQLKPQPIPVPAAEKPRVGIVFERGE
jgi:hypothetical protein